MPRSNVKLPKDGLLRTESSNAHLVTLRRRDAIIEALKTMHIYANAGVGTIKISGHGTSVIRVECNQFSTSKLVEHLLVNKFGVKETHLTSRKQYLGHCVIGVIL